MRPGIAVCLGVVAILACHSAQSLACGPAEYRQATELLADSSLRVDSSPDAAEQVLRSCGDDPTAAYLMGMFPRFAEFSLAKVEAFRQSLSRAADGGVPAAASIHGAWLFDTNADRVRAAQLMTEAYAAGDELAIGIGYGVMSGLGERLTDADLARLQRLSEADYPWAFAILASQSILRLSDDQGAHLSQEEHTRALLQAHETALKGVLRGDGTAALGANRIGEQLYKKSPGLEELAEVLSAPDPLAFVSSHPAEMRAAYLAWQTGTMPALTNVDQETLQLIETAKSVCSGRIPSKWKELCEVRAVADHYFCMRPFGAYMAEEAWQKSSAYQTCRVLRLRVLASAPYY
jgi:hypothetical protein